MSKLGLVAVVGVLAVVGMFAFTSQPAVEILKSNQPSLLL
jgi:hypothetical protein